MRPLAPALLLVALVLAGCAGNEAPPPEAPTPFMTNEQAQALLARAASELPSKFSSNATLLAASGQTIELLSTFDNESGSTYLDVRGDPQTLQSLMGRPGAAGYLRSGLTIYVTDAFALYLANGTAFISVTNATRPSVGSFVPDPEDTPLGALLRGDDLVRSLGGDGVEVLSAVPATHEGAPAAEIALTATRDERTATGTARVTLEPARIVHLDLAFDAGPGGDPLAGATMKADLLYDAEDLVRPSPLAARALSLAYETSRPAPSDRGNLTWTFLAGGSIRLEDVEVQVKQPPGATAGDPTALPTAWSMTLAEGTRSENGTTLTFTDADGDGALSKGDTLVATAEGGTLPPLVLYDPTTGLRVVPGGGALLALAALGVALVAWRARRG